MDPASGNIFLDIAKFYGPGVALIGFFVWQGYKREERMSARINELEMYIRDKLIHYLEQTNGIMKSFVEGVKSCPLVKGNGDEE